ncbi:MAG: SRPBCC family protein [Hyphomicrobiales bacterium]|nr:SRPBCC family protein [Hyphomicrobiales bacterium]
MRIALPVAALATLAASTVSAFALESKLSAPSSLSPDALWKKVGDFCGIGTWHPAAEKCELSADGKQRTISLKGGGAIVEHLVKWDDKHRSYSYTIVSGPLPVANYRSTIRVSPHGTGSMLTWTGYYKAKGASNADAKKAIDGVYDAGAKALTGG